MKTLTSFAALAAASALAPSAAAQISFLPQTAYPTAGVRAGQAATGDFDAANGIDFAVTSGPLSGVNGPEWLQVFRNDGAGGFAAVQTIALGNNVGAEAVVARDLDGDADLDLAVSLKNTNAVRVLFNAAGTFALGGTTAVGGSEPYHMAGADVDGDGDVDLVTSNRSSNDLSVLANDGAGAFLLARTLAVGLDPRFLALDDLDGDCRTDIAVAASDSRRVDVLLNLGGGTFGAPVSTPVPGNEKPAGMVAADLDADGDVDLATTTDNNGVGLVVVLRNAGNATFAAASYLSNGVNPDAIVAGDLDADGDEDLATADQGASHVSVLPNLGNATYGAATTFAVGAHPESLARADFTGDGSLDLVVANRDSGSASVLRNAGAGGTDTYCSTRPNSAGYGTRIDSSGPLSKAANAFTLMARCAPHGTLGLFYFGSATNDAPFGNGRRCVGGTLVRLGPPLNVSATGHALRPVDFTTFPANGITAGSTRYLQFWHRDVAGGGSLFNLSDGLRATFLP